MSNIIFYKTTADFDNTGEVLIYKSLLEFIRPHGKVIINDGKNIQAKFLTRIGVLENEKLSSNSKMKFVPSMVYFAIRSLFTRNQVYLVTGVGEHSIAGYKSIIKNILSFWLLFILHLLRVKVVRIGMSIRFEGFFAKLSEKILSSMFDYYYVRDGISFNNCMDAGIKKCKLAPDLSWGYKVLSKDESEIRKDVYMSFRFFCESKENSSLYQEKIVKVVKQLVLGIYNKIEGNIVFSYQCDEDEAFMSSIFQQLPHIPNLIMSKELITLDNADSYYGKAKLIISNRLHVLLLGYKFGAPTICITDKNKHRKILGILSDNGLQENLIDFDIAEDHLTKRVLQFLNNRDAIEDKYRATEEKNHNQLSNVFNHIFVK